MKLFCRQHHFAPAQVAEDSKDGVGDMDGGLEGEALVGKEEDIDDIDNEPEPPLLEVLLCHGPHRHDGDGVGESILHGDGGIGVG